MWRLSLFLVLMVTCVDSISAPRISLFKDWEMFALPRIMNDWRSKVESEYDEENPSWEDIWSKYVVTVDGFIVDNVVDLDKDVGAVLQLVMPPIWDEERGDWMKIPHWGKVEIVKVY